MMTLSHSNQTTAAAAYLATVPRFSSLVEAINALNDSPIASLDELRRQSISGGDINEASLLTLTDVDGSNNGNNQGSDADNHNYSQLFLKQNSLENEALLTSELLGLAAMREACVRTCQPLAIGVDKTLKCSFLVLSVIYPQKRSKIANSDTEGWQDLALQLATLHQASPPQPDTSKLQTPPFKTTQSHSTLPDTTPTQTPKTQAKPQQKPKWYAGWFENNFIGSSPQSNTWTADWYEFFATQRLGQQTKLAYDNGYLKRQTVQQIERLQHKLAHYLPHYSLTDNNGNPRPSLLHGDLWAGNAMIGHAVSIRGSVNRASANSRLANSDVTSDKALGFLIDPAVYVGHPETDLAMTHLFGGFSTHFYDAYLAHCPTESGFSERMDIYNLYHYLNHLNLFGTSYLSAVQRIAQRFGR